MRVLHAPFFAFMLSAATVSSAQGAGNAKATPTPAQAAAAAASSAEAAANDAAAAKRAVEALKASYPSSGDSYKGETLTLLTLVKGFVLANPGSTEPRCARAGSRFKVSEDDGTELTLYFLERGPSAQDGCVEQKAADKGIPGAPAAAAPALLGDDQLEVSLKISYKISKATLKNGYAFKRAGVSFGGLVVPFKFRLGDREVSSSTTVAPYFGFRTGWGDWLGISITPIISSGLGLVPVTDRATGQTETKPAFSVAAGLVLRSSKNDSFEAGLLLGRDILGKADTKLDPASKKGWISFYVGYTQ